MLEGRLPYSCHSERALWASEESPRRDLKWRHPGLNGGFASSLVEAIERRSWEHGGVRDWMSRPPSPPTREPWEGVLVGARRVGLAGRRNGWQSGRREDPLRRVVARAARFRHRGLTYLTPLPPGAQVGLPSRPTPLQCTCCRVARLRGEDWIACRHDAGPLVASSWHSRSRVHALRSRRPRARQPRRVSRL